ncbi:TldD/PmbA family protein [Candidatus Moduliflexus flocculans]|uniref:TldD/PmbA family protein n=1 Tax=Candidatus Moduliflexus flocculans TaxID=1499966 RepID=A0A0S6W6A5_9BACT|nr:TldD/PmbA family protein [Candidatus Moduliflexus flocculans]
MKHDLQPYTHLFQGYTELRVQERHEQRVAVFNGEVMENRRITTGGVAARAYSNGGWGMASFSNIEDATITQAIRDAADHARWLGEQESRQALTLPAYPGVDEHDLSAPQNELSRKDLIDVLRVVDGYLTARYPKLVSRVLTLYTDDAEKTLITSDGAAAYSRIPRMRISIHLTVEHGAERVSLAEYYGGLGYLQDYYVRFEPLYEQCDALYTHLQRKAEGIACSAGNAECVLEGDVAALLAYEAACEFSKIASGEDIASPLVSLVDAAHTFSGKPCPSPVFVDDEGTLAQDVSIIEQGISKAALLDKEDAARVQAQPTGNARAAHLHESPQLAPRNTALLAGSHRLPDMIASIENGYYLMKVERIQSPAGHSLFALTLGYEITHGRLGKGVRETVISGEIADMLRNVSMMSTDIRWLSGEWRGLPVGMAAPAVKCRILLGGK